MQYKLFTIGKNPNRESNTIELHTKVSKKYNYANKEKGKLYNYFFQLAT